jgi:hypothetical protein
MKLLHEKEIKLHGSEGESGIRILGYLEENNHTIGMYILERLPGDKTISVNIVAGTWGGDCVTSGKSAIFSVLILDSDPYFIFCDPNERQVNAYGKIAERIMNRTEVLMSPHLAEYKDMLDLIYQEECLPMLK